MARYFFSIAHRDGVLADRDGVELADDVDLAQCALYLADRLRQEASLSEASFSGCSIAVSNHEGKLLLQVPAASP
ncbi:hypothetical protein [Enterovirga sp.]|jgi:hypothetical protein|uniref:DUF6894 family protein n=1 Tax=Enterovirga sp. TaxID=2026350 RepID=UPI002628A91C|nr:hypothetical protein [Enterovirga sp.]MDB5590407.1 hypothetical protein [Enterovirga sp.]